MILPTTQPQNRVFSGVQPTGDLTLGNYLGAIKNFVALQKDYECLYCVVDMHAITVFQNPKQLQQSIRSVAAAYIAAGVDAKKNIIFNQSQVPEHAELGWILSCVARLGWLNRMTQFKDKAGKNRENASAGLYVYPNLMAADILLYRSTHVPVGEDQKQHLELARDIAQKFNNDWASQIRALGLGDAYFPQPEPIISGVATRIMSLRDGSKKMSKSDPSDMSRINMCDDQDTIAQKIRKARTDADVLPSELEGLKGRPEALNLVNIYAALADETPHKVLLEFAGQGFGAFKPALVTLAVEKLAPIAAEMARLSADETYIDGILREGAACARQIATPVMDQVKKIVGFVA